MSSHMSKKGYHVGDMKPVVEDYQLPASSYSQDQFGKTLNYVERQDRSQKEMASGIKKQSYKGRYS